MSEDGKIITLLTSAAMLMEDVSSYLRLQRKDVETTTTLLRDIAKNLQLIATAIEVIDR